MLNKFFGFLLLMGINGLLAIAFAMLACIVILIVVTLAMIPVSIIAGNHSANYVTGALNSDKFFVIVYACIFLSLMADDLGIPNVKTLYKRYLQKKPKHVD